jgi:acetate kinase
MGMTPLAGLVMGTRCGDVDPSVPLLLCTRAGLSPAEVDAQLNKGSGLQGLCGANDVRAIVQASYGHDHAAADARLALDVYARRIRHYLGAYWLELGGALDAIVFTAGVGENSAEVRLRVLDGLGAHLGATLDAQANARASAGHAQRPDGDVLDIATADSRVRVLVVRTNEELEIAEATRALLRGDACEGGLLPKLTQVVAVIPT